MGKGFEAFMKNPYWKKQYDNAPSDEVRKYYKLAWEMSPFVLNEEERKEIDGYITKEMKKLKLTADDYDYLANGAVGMSKMGYRKKAESLRGKKK